MTRTRGAAVRIRRRPPPLHRGTQCEFTAHACGAVAAGMDKGAIAVTCELYGETIETILNSELEHCFVEDPVRYFAHKALDDTESLHIIKH